MASFPSIIVITLGVVSCVLQNHFTSGINFHSDTGGDESSVPQGRSVRAGSSSKLSAAASSSSANSNPSCSQAGMSPHEDAEKYIYCFSLGGNMMISQITDCPKGMCFDSSTSCCDVQACGGGSAGSGEIAKNTDMLRSLKRGKRNAEKKHITEWNKDVNVFRRDVNGGKSSTLMDQFEISSFEMAYLHRTSPNKYKKACGNPVACMRTGAFPNNMDMHSYYRCTSAAENSEGYQAQLFNCPSKLCFRYGKCRKCKK